MSTAGKPLIGGNTSPVLKKVYFLLKPDGDFSTPGEWFDYETILQEAMKIVTPGQAIRFAEQERAAMARKEGRSQGPRTKHVNNYDLQVAAGQRGIARQRIWGSAHTELSIGENGNKIVRFAPGMGRKTHAGARSVRMTGVSKQHVPYRLRNKETSDQHAGDACEHHEVPGADDEAHPQPEGR